MSGGVNCTTPCLTRVSAQWPHCPCKAATLGCSGYIAAGS